MVEPQKLGFFTPTELKNKIKSNLGFQQKQKRFFFPQKGFSSVDEW